MNLSAPDPLDALHVPQDDRGLPGPVMAISMVMAVVLIIGAACALLFWVMP